MTKLISALKEVYNKYTFLSPVLFVCITAAILWLNTKYVTKTEFAEHMLADKLAVESFVKGNDATHKDIIDFNRAMDKKIDAILAGKDVTVKHFELISLMQKKQDEELIDIKSRLLFLERQKLMLATP